MNTRHLRLELWSGERGLGHEVTWAQASDLDNPWDWMTGGELLMKNGLTMPRSVDAQIEFVTHLHDHAISGLVLGMDPDTPPIAAKTLGAAEQLSFPILVAPYSVGFGAIGRIIADQNVSDESRRLTLTSRVYTTIRRAVAGPAGLDVLGPLARDLACRVTVLDADTGLPAIDGAASIPDALRTAVVAEVRRRGGALPGVVHLDADGLRAHMVDVPDVEPTVLLAYDFRAAPPDIALLLHIATASAVLLSQQGIRRELERRVGGELLAAMMDGRLGDLEAAEALAQRGLYPDGCVLIAATGGTDTDEQRLHLSFHRRSIPNLVVRRAGYLYALLPDDRAATKVLHNRLGSRARLGISNALRQTDRVPDAVREANWAVRAAEHTLGNINRYADASALSVLRGTDDARLFVDRVLGTLIEYDTSHSTELLTTLDTYLSCNRSWQQASARLGVHRQTVVYRIHRVEELTDRDLKATGHISELWLALRARDMLSVGNRQS
ncbi:helix-turn-helix domain-containing protein [Gordonia sp. CPCC 205515]|uniref:helix-turn-helix domain-containing protein n=1 Tax=Gordonia sp. CPCC 205515 TaxID=3140791 RepID=UPI003AF3A02F